MATVVFYEKPGCINNTRQKQLLSTAGHQVITKNLLTESWQADVLQSFFVGLPVCQWFNYSAPAIKHGDIDPEAVDAETALALMRDNPLLIRRPLMQVGERRLAGFDSEQVNAWLGLAENHPARDLETCLKPPDKAGCRHD